MARRGANIIVAVSFAQTSAVETVSAEFPEVKFTLIDGVVDAPNVQSIVFKEHEGSYLVGIAGGLASKTGKVGFIGGMDIPLIRKFACGYEQGAKHANPDAEVLVNMTGNTPAAWNDPTKGGELARSQFDRGADVVFAAAGGTGVGVYQAAVDAASWRSASIPIRTHLHPGLHADLDGQAGRRRGRRGLQLGHGRQPGSPVSRCWAWPRSGVGWALDEHNRALVIRPTWRPSRGGPKEDHRGDIKVADYMANNDCSYVSLAAAEAVTLWGRRRRKSCARSRPRRSNSPAIDKRFGAVHANRAVDMTVARGNDPRHRRRERRRQVDPDEHPLRISTRPTPAKSGSAGSIGPRSRRPKDAIAVGIGMVHQHFMLVEQLHRAGEHRARRRGRLLVAAVAFDARGGPWKTWSGTTA